MPLLSLAQTRLLIPDTLSGTSISLNLQNITHNHGGHSMKNMDDMSAKLISSKAQKELAGIFDAYLIIKNDLVFFSASYNSSLFSLDCWRLKCSADVRAVSSLSFQKSAPAQSLSASLLLLRARNHSIYLYNLNSNLPNSF